MCQWIALEPAAARRLIRFGVNPAAYRERFVSTFGYHMSR
ncbi:hypothetical protein SAMN04489716_9566 [Actinoplanes derwentensis]|uniref:Uncharacterized protein n=1 Tax=Actinoplanes derwentensis TaxID=113562 RepID=A0A1H2DGB4_9ACTN|nr:hypothetical protein SAMN04489716_9566 [Actinoplanes derwentensis]